MIPLELAQGGYADQDRVVIENGVPRRMTIEEYLDGIIPAPSEEQQREEHKRFLMAMAEFARNG